MICHCGQMLREEIDIQSIEMPSRALTAEDFSPENCTAHVPLELFNLLAVIANTIKEPPEPGIYTKVEEDVKSKIMAIC